MGKTVKPEYLAKVKRLTKEETERLLSRMGGKLDRRLEKRKVSQEEALARQLELEDEQLQEWRKMMRILKEKEEAKEAKKEAKKKEKSKTAKTVHGSGKSQRFCKTQSSRKTQSSCQSQAFRKTQGSGPKGRAKRKIDRFGLNRLPKKWGCKCSPIASSRQNFTARTGN